MTDTTTMEHYVAPRVNVLEDRDAIRIEVELPGVAREDAEVEVRDGRLVLIGRRPANGTSGQYRIRERPAAGYYRAFALSDAIDSGKVEAEMHDGVLKVTLPKVDRLKARTITVN